MKNIWLKNILPIAAIYAFRMLGLMMLIPVFTLYAGDLKGATPYLIGIAFGAYGLSQGLLQIPFGFLSDIIGRKKIIAFGLILLVIGSILGALATTINQMIVARILQGSGAIGSALIALLTDLTPNEIRTKAMAVIGANIGLSFSIAIIVSPIIASKYNLPGIFYLTVLLAVIGLILLYFIVPNPEKRPQSIKPNFKKILADLELLRLNISIFLQHLIFTSTFFVIPLILKQHNLMDENVWKFYLPILLLSFIAILPIISLSERFRQVKLTFLSAIALTAISQFFMIFFAITHWYVLIMLVFLYFMAFNLLEPLIPSIVSRVAKPESKGSSMGVYSSFQFFGLFAGGVTAGSIYALWGINGVFTINFILGCIWIIINVNLKCDIYSPKNPKNLHRINK